MVVQRVDAVLVRVVRGTPWDPVPGSLEESESPIATAAWAISAST